MDVTALLGRPRKGMTIRRYTSDYPEQAEPIEKSRFVTFEISFEDEVADFWVQTSDEQEDDISIDQ